MRGSSSRTGREGRLDGHCGGWGRYLCVLFTRWFTWVVLLDLRRLFIARDPASSCGGEMLKPAATLRGIAGRQSWDTWPRQEP